MVHWTTFNEPATFCFSGYSTGGHAPGVGDRVAPGVHLARHDLQTLRGGGLQNPGRPGDRVVHWTTFNEPATFCFSGYSTGGHAPGVRSLARRLLTWPNLNPKP